MSIAEPLPVIENIQRHFAVALHRCIVTGALDKCIRVKLCEIPWNDDGSGRSVEIYGNFSKEGLQSLLTDLESAPSPLTLPTSNEIRQGNPYQWIAIYEDGTSVQQFMCLDAPNAEGLDDEEIPLNLVDFSRVREFWISPRNPWSDLPLYGLIKGEGFVTRHAMGTTHKNLGLPFPQGDWQWNYYRRITLSFTSMAGQNEVWPTHVRQVIGWQVGDPEDPTILEIGVEEDGSWSVFKKTPIDSPFWNS